MLYEAKRPVLPTQSVRVYFKFAEHSDTTLPAQSGSIQIAITVGQELFGPYPSHLVTTKAIWQLRRSKPHLSPKRFDRRLSELETKLLAAWRDLLDEGQPITGEGMMHRAELPITKIAEGGALYAV